MHNVGRPELSLTANTHEHSPPPFERVLLQNETTQINIDQPIADAQEMHDKIGITANLVATIDAGNKKFLILDTRDLDTNRDFYVVEETSSTKDEVGYKGLRKDERVIIGRDHHTDRFTYPDTVSRKHFEISYADNGMYVHNLFPKNSTKVLAHTAPGQDPEDRQLPYPIYSDRTVQAVRRLRHNPNFGEKDEDSPYGYYMNMPIIGKNSDSVEGGVYLGGSSREAIVVDGKSEAMKRVYNSLESDLKLKLEDHKQPSTHDVLSSVMQKVQEVMPYDEYEADQISRQYFDDQLIGLSTYIEAGAGICRHQGLLAAYVIEGLIKDGYLEGSIGVERNTVEVLGGTHAWAAYKNGSNEVIVIDPAQNFVGTKAKALEEDRWDYRITSETY